MGFGCTNRTPFEENTNENRVFAKKSPKYLLTKASLCLSLLTLAYL
jgi:hypothetical protein